MRGGPATRCAAWVLGLAVVAFAVSLLARPRTGGPSAPPVQTSTATPLRCDFTPGDRLAFEVQFDGFTELDQGVVLGRQPLGAERLARSVAGLMLWRALPPAQPGQALFAGVIVPSSVVEQGAPVEADRAGYGSRAFFTMDARCRFTGVAFEADAPATARGLWEGLLAQIQVVAPEDPAAQEWSAVQPAGTGEARMYYRRGTPGSIERRIGRMIGASSPPPPQTTVRASRASARLDPRGAWLAALESDLDVEERGGGQVGVRSRVRATLRRTEPTEHPFFAQGLAADGLVFRALGAAPPAPPPGRPHDGSQLDDARRETPAAALAAEAWGVWQSSDPQRRDDALRMLALAVRSRPGLAREFAALLLAGKLPDEQAALLLSALRDACTAEGTAALRMLAGNKRLTTKLRRAAIMSLGSSPMPDRDTAEALLDVVQGGAGDALRDQGKLAAGQILAHKALPPEERGRVHAAVERTLEEAQGPVDQINALRAAENSGDPSFRARAEAQLHSGDLLVRRAAWEAWIALGGEEKTAASVLLRAAGEGQEDDRLLVSFERWSADPSRVSVGDEDLRLAASLLRADSPAVQRALAIDLLGRAGQAEDAWKRVLREWYPAEPVDGLKARIGRYLTYDELFR